MFKISKCQPTWNTGVIYVASCVFQREDESTRRRRRPLTDDMGESSDSQSRLAPDSKPRDPNKPETMAERMHRRRAIRSGL